MTPPQGAITPRWGFVGQCQISVVPIPTLRSVATIASKGVSYRTLFATPRRIPTVKAASAGTSPSHLARQVATTRPVFALNWEQEEQVRCRRREQLDSEALQLSATDSSAAQTPPVWGLRRLIDLSRKLQFPNGGRRKRFVQQTNDPGDHAGRNLL